MAASNKPGFALELYGTEDPSAGAGVAAPVGAVYLRVAGAHPNRTGTIWQKTGQANTAWSQLAVVEDDGHQEFSYLVTGLEGNPFNVPLPVAAAGTGYNVHIQQANANGSGNAFKLWRPLYDVQTVNAARIECNVAPEANDVLLISIDFPT